MKFAGYLFVIIQHKLPPLTTTILSCKYLKITTQVIARYLLLKSIKYENLKQNPLKLEEREIVNLCLWYLKNF